MTKHLIDKEKYKKLLKQNFPKKHRFTHSDENLRDLALELLDQATVPLEEHYKKVLDGWPESSLEEDREMDKVLEKWEDKLRPDHECVCDCKDTAHVYAGRKCHICNSSIFFKPTPEPEECHHLWVYQNDKNFICERCNKVRWPKPKSKVPDELDSIELQKEWVRGLMKYRDKMVDIEGALAEIRGYMTSLEHYLKEKEAK